MGKYIVVSDRTHAVISDHETREDAISSLESQGYNHHSGWTYRNAETRDYRHVSTVEQFERDRAIVGAANAAGMTVDAYLQGQ